MEREAGFWIRLGAKLLDGIIIGIPISLLASIFIGEHAEDLFKNTVNVLYSMLLPIFWSGYTVGKRLCNIRIRNVNDQMPPTFLNMLLRDVVSGLVYAFTFGIGIIVSICMVCMREDKRSLHDLIAGTEVIHD
ncbi:RDD family protein [Paenibacillus endoradicis]|uniref:RDD family protein n=1 Tax=Paenibacillus endoradicis TaxID=2972487 RepID=UPI0021591C6F|nr:RDD family protein [Paenibacillus endoradicis]MCR8655956.1 RDD family protein [Paenibacillus endoradicis]MCR8658282.1 RDD family protein [Paenibacillus endoradicis]